MGHLGQATHLISPEPGRSLSIEDESRTAHVLAFHSSTRYSPLHQAVNRRVHRLSSPSCPLVAIYGGLPIFSATHWTEPKLVLTPMRSLSWASSELYGTIELPWQTPSLSSTYRALSWSSPSGLPRAHSPARSRSGPAPTLAARISSAYRTSYNPP